MAKELVISSSRHETKVAVLEDDQLVEVYFQRGHEYSLAGSIHKGRVTRVLPGMQSAFVDLGLERDTFLYVSDFVDETGEEYDRVADERPSRPSRTDAAVLPPPPPPNGGAMPGVSVAAAGERPEQTESRGLRDRDRDRRNRRSRRRRGRERGLPESKYALAGEPAAEAEPETEAPAERGPEPSFPVLPGESLAKYSRPAEAGAAPEPAPAPDAGPADEPQAEAESGALPESAETRAGTAAETEDRFEEPPAEEAEEPEAAGSGEPLSEFEESEIREMIAEAQAEADLRQAVAQEPADEEDEDEDEDGEEEDEEQSLEERGAGAAPDEVPDSTAEVLEEEESEASDDELAAGDSEEGGAPQAATGSEEGGDAVAAPAEEEVEPARIPVSLTATLREQGQRYLHRVSRRMRRKMRQESSQAAPAQARAVVPEAAEPAVREVQAEQKPERPERPMPSISDLLREGQEIIVQIAKEPLGQKGARITSHIALPGRYVVYMPTLDHAGVSRKISSEEERQRLKRILQTHRAGKTGGFIMRTAGEGRSEEEIAADMNFLYNLWLDIKQKAEKKRAPALLHHDLDIVQRVLRDQLTEQFKAIWTDSEEVYESVIRFTQRFQPNLVSRVKLYTRQTPIFDAFGITQELEKALRPKVWLKSGGYIVINQTEALVAIDVNTGKFVGKSNRLEDTIVKTNTEAVKEIVRQIRLRDLGGIIVIDFIDMDERKNRQKVMQALEEAMRADRAPYKILQFNDFGLVAITRKRVKQSLERTLCSPCPYCDGAGYVKSVQTVISEIIQEAHKIARAVEDSKDVILRVNPEVAKVIKSTNNTYLEELEGILKRPVLVRSDPLLHQEKFDLA